MRVKNGVKTAIIAGIVLVLQVLCIVYIFNQNAIDNMNPIAKNSMLKTTLEWG